MTDTLRIERMRVRYRLPAGRPDLRRRLDRVLDRVLDEELEPALERAGVDPRSEICIQTVDVPVRLGVGSPDRALGEAWSAALAAAIARAASGRGRDVVRYSSRTEALTDFAVGVAAGDLSRAWAWRQVGLVARPGTLTAETAQTALVAALLAEPELIVAVLRSASAARALRGLIALLHDVELAVLARAARAAVTGTGSSGELPAIAAAGEARSEAPPAVVAAARRILERSVVLRDVAPLARGVARARVEALAGLALVEVEPALARGAWVQVAEVVSERLGEASSTASAKALDPVVPVAAVEGPVSERPEEALDAPGRLPISEGEVADDPTEPPRVPTDTATTAHAGLLFLVGIIDELGLPGKLLAGDLGERHSLAWALHRLALRLARTEERDPAALAFAGLGPEDDPPSVLEGEPDRDELAQLDRIVRSVARRAARRLGRQPGRSRELLDRVCRRPGEVVAEPGWIELRLPLDSVDTELRRAGLDLDPGWVPWLGVVLRFVYG
jgi:hypothetical protein